MTNVEQDVDEAVRAGGGVLPNDIGSRDVPRIPYVEALAPFEHKYHDGDKFPGGFGSTQILEEDYWTLRARSAQLFKTNPYARGIIRRFVTNVINTGLHLEAEPDEGILGFEQDALDDWTEDVENRFALWGRTPLLCDHTERMTFGQLQALAYMEALVSGDVLAVLRQDVRTGLPRLQLISGQSVQSPWESPRRGNRIEHGVEMDSTGRQVAYWVVQEDGKSKRLPAFGEKSGRRIAWLVYATEKRADAVRGEPLLSLALQSLREIDRYRDSVQRKAVINSVLALFIQRDEDGRQSRSIGAGASRKGTITEDKGTGNKDRTFKAAEFNPGLIAEDLQPGEKPVAFGAQGTDEKFGEFESAIVHTIAWAYEMPPEILRLTFGHNYSASQAAINEFKMFLERVRQEFGDGFCAPVYVEWMLSQVLTRRVAAPGFLDSWRNMARYDVFWAWVQSSWTGQIKPAVDMSKLVTGFQAMVAEGFMTRRRATRLMGGGKYSKVVKELAKENEMLREANAPIGGMEGAKATPPGPASDPDDDGDEDETKQGRAA